LLSNLIWQKKEHPAQKQGATLVHFILRGSATKKLTIAEIMLLSLPRKEQYHRCDGIHFIKSDQKTSAVFPVSVKPHQTVPQESARGVLQKTVSPWVQKYHPRCPKLLQFYRDFIVKSS
jgi:hypothetical protein